MKNSKYLFLFALQLLFYMTIVFGEAPQGKSGSRPPEPGTSRKERDAYRKYLIENVIRLPLQMPLTNETARKWMSAWWGCELTGYRDSLVLNSLKFAISQHIGQAEDLVRAALEAAFTLYSNELEKEALSVIHETSSPKIFAIASLIIIKCSADKSNTRNDLLRQLQKRFPSYMKNPLLKNLYEDFTSEKRQMPPLRDLIYNSKWKDNIVIFSFHRKNRNYPGLTVIRDSDGNLLNDEKGEIFSVPHLARSISNLPGYITNGNTPSGILSILHTGISDNAFIGESPVIVTALPYEIQMDRFFRDSSLSGIPWSTADIKRLLPGSWQNYSPVFESMNAGEAGRSEIIMHGTAIDPEYYRGETYFPNTPSLGCLTACELYNPRNGKMIMSNQKKLLNAFNKCRKQTGYLVILDLNDKKAPVTLQEIKKLLKKK